MKTKSAHSSHSTDVTDRQAKITARRYLVALLCSVLGSAAIVVTLNAVIDPFGVSPLHVTVADLNAVKVLRPKFDRIVRPIDVWMRSPSTIFIGGSRTKQSFDPAVLDQTNYAPAYNAAMDAGSGLGEIHRHLEYYIRTNSNLKTVFIELFPQSLIRIRPGTKPQPIGILESFKNVYNAYFTYGAVNATFETIFQNRRYDGQSRTIYDGMVSGFVPYIPRISSHFSVNNYPNFIVRRGRFSRPLKFHEKTARDISGIVQLCKRAAIPCSFFISPVHTAALYAYHHNGMWGELERMKEFLANIDAEVLDFMRYNPIIDEKVSDPVKYWPEAFHYSSALGTLMLRRISKQHDGSLPDNFGIPLKSETINQSLVDWKTERDRWIEDNPTILLKYRSAEENHNRRQPVAGQALGFTTANEVIIEGSNYPIRIGTTGVLEGIRPSGKTLLFVGWAGDMTKGERATQVAIFNKDKLIALIAPSLERNNSAFLSYNSLIGFRVNLPPASTGQIDKRAVRAFALFGDQTAGELQIRR